MPPLIVRGKERSFCVPGKSFPKSAKRQTLQTWDKNISYLEYIITHRCSFVKGFYAFFTEKDNFFKKLT